MRYILLLWIFTFILSASTARPNSSCDTIIPKPQSSISGDTPFIITKNSRYLSDTTLATDAIRYLQKHLSIVSNYQLHQSNTDNLGSIKFHYNPKSVKKSEGYRLNISRDKIDIEARDSAGFFYATISLMQLMDSSIWGRRHSQKQWSIPACSIIDYPQYKWRGMMLDSARNFFKLSYVKKFIDRMAQHKLNRFHWHLSDDEGWRIEIKRYPLLTKIGATRGPGTKLPFSTYPTMRGPKNRVESGFYTQKEIIDIVAYAKARSIEIVPEIDMPAHAKAAVVSYPKRLLDPDDRSKFRSIQKVQNNVINPALDSSYIFLDNVISEVVRIFPFEYIHLGGDEVPSKAWSGSPAVRQLMRKHNLNNNKDIENYFFAKMDKIVSKYHRKLIGWQALINAKPKIRKDSIIMVWRSPEAANKVIKKGYNAILSPVQYLYFDQQYVRTKSEYGHTWSTPISTKKVYSYRPSKLKKVQGIQANLWSETLLDEKIADYLAWPRALALSEIAWTAQKRRDWRDFKQRVDSVGIERLREQGIHYRGAKAQP